MTTYHTLITNNGKAQIANAINTNTKVAITHLAVGDGRGATPTPNASATRLTAEKARVAVNHVGRHATNASWIEVHAIIPSSMGGFTVREIGLYAGTTLIAVGSFPATYKPSATEGGAREMSIKLIITVENASIVNVTLDDSLVYATRKWAEDNFVNHDEVIDNLASTETTKPLSAHQGKVLNDKITATDIKADTKANASTTIIAGNGLTGGGNMTANRTVALGTPSQITASSTNSVTATSHTHAIDKASTSVAGVVQLNDTLASTSTNQALTANQGKVLDEKITALGNEKLALRGRLNTTDLNTLNAANHTGVWYQDSNRNALAEYNYPDQRAGILFVLPSVWQGQQLYFPYNEAVIYSRHVNGSNWSAWLKTGDIVNNLESTSVTAGLSANQGKILNDTKLGNTGHQTLNGQLSITRNAWEKLRFTNSDGSFWRFESAPISSGENGARFNYVFTGSEGTEVGRISFPRVSTGETIAYQSWVQTANVATATKLQTPRTINGVAFDGTKNITITDNSKAPAVHRHTWSEIDSKPAVITNPTQITSGDLDNYKEIGVYYCEGNAYARNIANTPSNRAFALEVVRAAGVVQIFREYETAVVYMRAFYNSWSPWKRLATTEDNAPTATRLATARTLAITGDGTGQASFDGSANANIDLTLANSGVTAGSYNSVTVDAKGRVTRGLTQTHGLVTATSATGTTNTATTNTNTFLNIVASGVGQTASVGSSTQITGTNGITVSSDTAGKLIVTRDSNSPTATKLQTARQIALTGAVTGNVNFDGSGNVSMATTLNLTDFANLKSENGYQKLPNGLIFQWGRTPLVADESSADITFPVAFPTAVVSIQLTEDNNTTRNAHATHCVARQGTTTGFNFWINSTLATSTRCYWFAIGY